MAIDTLVGQDTIIVNNRILTNLPHGTVVEITSPSTLTEMESGKDGNTIMAFQEAGRQAEVKIKVLVGSSDDVFLNNLLEGFKRDFAGSTLINATFEKRTGDGKGNIRTTTWVMEAGAPTTPPGDKYDVSGDRDQAIMEYAFKFGRAQRQLS